jgi:glycosyltransferase involved in cell wall biosynthesis
VLPDRVPILQSAPNKDYSNVPYTVVFVCTFALDEPYREVIEATRSLVDVATVHVTGGFDVEDWSGSVPQNLRFSGYLPDVAYEDLLRRSDVVVDLTAMEDCLVCGGYEAVALEKPLVTSDTRALRACFSRGTVFTRHDSTSIAAAIKDALNRRDELGHEMTLLRRDLEAAWEARKPVLMTQLEALAAK